MSDINNILNLINETKKELACKIYIPSIKKEVSFLPLTANNQKELVKALIDSPIYSTLFNVRFIEILKSVIIGEDVDSFTAFDKALITLKLRSENVSDDYSKTFKDNDDKSFEKIISIQKHIDKLGTVSHPEPQTIEVDNYKILLDYPTIKTDLEFEKYLANRIATIDSQNENALRGMLSLFYITNILKYIKEIEIKETKVVVSELPLDERLSLGESLPSKLTRMVIDKIDEYFGKNILSILDYEFQKDGEKYKSQIDLDNKFFMA